MHALTLHQPWASLIAGWPALDAYAAAGLTAFRPKRIENRDWLPPVMVRGKAIAIHAGKTFDGDADTDIRRRACDAWVPMPERADLPLGAVVAVARVVGYVEDVGSDIRAFGGRPSWAPADPTLLYGSGWWFLGPYGWLLDDVARLSEPVPCRGMQKVWSLPRDVAQAVEVQVQRGAPPAPAWVLPPADADLLAAFAAILERRGKITVEIVVQYARETGVDFWCLLARLEQIGAIKRGIWERLRDEDFDPIGFEVAA